MPSKTDGTSDELYHFEGFDGPNTTPVPDLFFDELLTKLKEAELRTLLYIIRRTYGFKRQKDNISFNQFLRGITTKDGRRLDHGCGITHRTTLIKALRSLEAMGIITSEKRKDEKGEHLTTVYKLRFKKEHHDDDRVGNHARMASEPENRVVRQTHHQGSAPNAPPVVRQTHPRETVKQQTEINLSSIRKALPKNEERNEEGEGNQPPLEAPRTESANKPPKLPQPEKPGKETREGESSPTRSEPKLSSQVLPPGLTRQYLSAARSKTQRPGNPQGLVSLASVLPNPPTPKRTYSQERQVLVDVIADLAREFRDEATLTESVSRAYNLMGEAGITDIGIFTSKIYEARSITKERYGSIKRGRMPYFFSVLEDVCGQRRKSAFKPDAPS